MYLGAEAIGLYAKSCFTFRFAEDTDGKENSGDGEDNEAEKDKAEEAEDGVTDNSGTNADVPCNK